MTVDDGIELPQPHVARQPVAVTVIHVGVSLEHRHRTRHAKGADMETSGLVSGSSHKSTLPARSPSRLVAPYSPITPIPFSHASASCGHPDADSPVRRRPNACPPFAYTWISAGTPALRSAVA